MYTESASNNAGARILIVEDEAVIAMDMAEHLRDFGFDVVGTAATGERAQQLAAQTHPDLIMMDIVIKGPIDGIETARLIREHNDVSVVFLTAYGDKSTLDRAKLASPSGYLLKPFRPNDLRTTIEVGLHQHALSARLRESERWLNKTLQCIGDGIVATDPSGQVRFMNRVAEQLIGLKSAEALGREAHEVVCLIDEHSHSPLPDLIAQAMQGDANTPLVGGLLQPRDGKPARCVDAGAAPIRDDDGRLLGGVLVLRDVTQRRLDERELLMHREHLEQLVRERTADLEAAKLEAERASEAKSAFLSSMSHELRTPMNAVLGFSQLLEMERLDARQAGYVRHIHRSGDHLLRLIDDLLDLSTINAGRLTVALRPVNVAAVIAQADPLLQPLVAQRGVTIDIDPGVNVSVMADPMRLTQVLVNLLSNAVKYNRQGGQVSVNCMPVGLQRVRISITDTGHGIAPDKQPMLFRAFERLGAENTGVGGVGIGLAFAKRLTELMNGELGFQSEFGVGSTFWIELPLAAG